MTETGSTRSTANAISQQVRKYRTFYFGLDTGTCASSGDWYTGLPCRTETQSSGGTVYARAAYTYVASGTYAGLPKTVAYYRSSGDSTPLTTTFGSHNAFGTPTTVQTPAGVTTTYTMNGWNAPTQTVEASAILNDADTPTASSITTGFAYNKLRALSRTTLPKGNYEDSIYYTGSTDYARVKARALLDTSTNKLELMRYVYDKFGNVIEDRVLDSISGSTPCADEGCSTYDVRGERKFNANRQVTEAYLHATDTTSPPDATQAYSYTSGQLTQVTDYRGTVAAMTYDSQGRVATQTADNGGLGAQTQYTYDLHGRTATVTAPAGVITFYEYDDFGQLVIERSKTRGDMRFDYDTAGAQTKRRRTAHKVLTSPEDTCSTRDWLGRLGAVDYDCDATNAWTFYYDGASTPASACPSASNQTGQLSMMVGPAFTRVLCHHPSGALYGSYHLQSTTWSNTTARGTQTIFDTHGNITKEHINVGPTSRTNSRIVEYVYSSSMPDRVDYVRHQLYGAGTWTYVTSNNTSPTYFAYGGMKTLAYANGITETNTRDYARRLTRRLTQEVGGPKAVYTDINLTYDVNGNVTLYDDSAGYRHTKYFAAMDKLDRLRCLSRATISSCSGAEPWETKYNESFDYDLSGNRTNRRFGAFNTADDDAYTYASGPTDIIDKVTSRGTDQQMSNTFKGDLTEVNQPNLVQFTLNYDSRVTDTNDSVLGGAVHYNSYFGDRYVKKSPCNARLTRYYYRPLSEGGASPYVNFIDAYGTCADEYPREYRGYIYLDDKPLAVVHSTMSSGGTQTETGTFWMHADQLGTPVLVTNSSKVERWRWENDPFGREKPIEYTLSAQDVNPDDDSSTGGPPVYNTCCCTTCGVSGCGTGAAGCGTGCCSGATSQAMVWSKTYSPGSATNVRVHFSQFDVKAGATRKAKDYVSVLNGASTVVADLTGDLGDFWGPWSGDGTATVRLYADNVADATRGVVIDKLEYTTAANGKFVMHLRMPGQIWDDEVKHAYNYQRWYRAEDGRYVSPDPIGRAGGEDGYSAYVNSNPLSRSDSYGLSAGDGTGGVATHRGPGLYAGAVQGCWDVDLSQIGLGQQSCLSGVGFGASPQVHDQRCSTLLPGLGSTTGTCVNGSLVCRVTGCANVHIRRALNTYCQDSQGAWTTLACRSPFPSNPMGPLGFACREQAECRSTRRTDNHLRTIQLLSNAFSGKRYESWATLTYECGPPPGVSPCFDSSGTANPPPVPTPTPAPGQ